ncbi:arylsulfatase [Prosthecobacter dejongeii]|uniref:Arylsulfatase n=1 Tax=Prosthecobacter dejongeii TaxID=48465 RepID=A0A7W8DNY1_9BACT|nr:arylsulfatase [Prosthecobacter dejongeii]MBB5036858.1 arylsulfatase [Prosthecobacter dejongeii]
MIRCILFCLLSLSSLVFADLAGTRPNIVFILTDDQGYGDLSAHGNPILKTPHLDQLRSESVRFSDFIVSPTCAPTRSALLTGRHEFRNGITHTILERERLDPKATTIAQVLKTAGYTTGIFGKWHLGDEPEYRPRARGFDEQFIHGGGGIGQSYPGSCGDAPGNTYFDPAILHNDKFVKTKGYCTDVFFAQASQWMASVKGKQPFYCHIATNAPHSPYIARPEDKALYAGKVPDDDAASFFGMIHNIDENVGRLIAKLDEWGIAQNTLVVFMNDNGGTAGVKVYNADMRGAKGTPWRGGTRAMSFWRWPGKIQEAECTALTAHVDVFRTWASLAGASLNPTTEMQAEGRNLLPLLENPKAEWPERTLFSHVGRWQKGTDYHAAKNRNASIRTPQYQLVSEGPRPQRPKAETPTAGWQLFDLRADPSQTRNLAAEKPEIVNSMLASYDQWWDSLKGQIDLNETAKGPKLNPFAEEYWKQFGGQPTAEDLARMNPDKAWTFETQRAKKK